MPKATERPLHYPFDPIADRPVSSFELRPSHQVAPVGSDRVDWFMHFVGVIPARYASQRLPGKALLTLAGKPLIQWVYEAVLQSRFLSETIVATDDERIFKSVEDFGGRVLMTSPDHQSGTDRVAEIARLRKADVYVNIQGDEPLISPITVDAICRPFLENRNAQISTACVRIRSGHDISDPNNVKVVFDRHSRALYFSRTPIPFARKEKARYFKHLGIYGYAADTLQKIAALEPSELERTEGLEQLRFLENGIPIQVVEVSEDSIGVDTEEDVRRVTPLLENTSKVRHADHHS